MKSQILNLLIWTALFRIQSQHKYPFLWLSAVKIWLHLSSCPGFIISTKDLVLCTWLFFIICITWSSIVHNVMEYYIYYRCMWKWSWPSGTVPAEAGCNTPQARIQESSAWSPSPTPSGAEPAALWRTPGHPRTQRRASGGRAEEHIVIQKNKIHQQTSSPLKYLATLKIYRSYESINVS